jgi:hypothetical protein
VVSQRAVKASQDTEASLHRFGAVDRNAWVFPISFACRPNASRRTRDKAGLHLQRFEREAARNFRHQELQPSKFVQPEGADASLAVITLFR